MAGDHADARELFWGEVLDNFGEEMDGVIWPIFIFLLLENTISVGAVGSLISIGALVFTYLIGKASDKIDKGSLIRLSAILFTLLWLGRYFFDNQAVYMVSNLLAGFLMMMFFVTYGLMISNFFKE